MLKNIVIILVFGISIGCKEYQEPKIYLNPEYFKKSEVLLSKYANDVRYIPLSSEIYIKSIRAIEFCENYIFIGAGTEGMLVYGKDGSFYRKIGNRGKGPGEYYSVNSFTIDFSNKLIYILDAGPKTKVMVYTFDGEYKNEFINPHLNGNFQKIVFQDEKLYLFEIIVAGNANYNWVEIDLQGKVISEKLNCIPKFITTNTIMINPIYRFKGGIGYWNQYNDTVFRIENGKISAKLFFAGGEHRIPTSHISSSSFNNYFVVTNILESTKYFWITEYKRPANNIIIIDKQNGLAVMAKNRKEEETFLTGLINDINGGNFEPKRYYYSGENEYLIGWTDAYQIKSIVTSKVFKNMKIKYPEKKKALEKLAKSLNENDNPVLMLVKLKE